MHLKHRDPKTLRTYCSELMVDQFQLQSHNGEVSQGKLLSYEILDDHSLAISFTWLYYAQKFVVVGRGRKAQVFVQKWRPHPIDPRVSSKIVLNYDYFYPQPNKGRVKITLEGDEFAYFISKDNLVGLIHDPEDPRMISVQQLLLPMSAPAVIKEQLRQLV
jgi:hypothetical protein